DRTGGREFARRQNACRDAGPLGDAADRCYAGGDTRAVCRAPPARPVPVNRRRHPAPRPADRPRPRRARRADLAPLPPGAALRLRLTDLQLLRPDLAVPGAAAALGGLELRRCYPRRDGAVGRLRDAGRVPLWPDAAGAGCGLRPGGGFPVFRAPVPLWQLRAVCGGCLPAVVVLVALAAGASLSPPRLCSQRDL